MADGESYKHFDHERKSLTHPRTARTSRRRLRERERETYYSGFILHENNTAANHDVEISCSGASPCSNPTPIYDQTAPSRPSLPPRPLLRRLSTDRSKDQSFLESRARSHTHKKRKNTQQNTNSDEGKYCSARATRERETAAAAVAKLERMTRTRGRKKERRWRKGAKRGFEDLRSGYVCAHQKRNTLPLSPFRFEEKTRAAGRKAQWDPANEQRTHLPPDLPATCSSFLCWNFRSPTSCIEEFCQRMRECSRELADAAATFCDGVFCGGGREGRSEAEEKRREEKRREEKRDTVAAAAAAHALLSSQQFLKKSAATAPPPSLQQNQQQKTNIRCSITDDNSLLLHEEHHHHHHHHQ